MLARIAISLLCCIGMQAHANNNPLCSNQEYMNGANRLGCMELDISDESKCQGDYNITDHGMQNALSLTDLQAGCSRITRDRYRNSFHEIFESRLATTAHDLGEIEYLTYHHQAGGRGGDGRAWSVYTGIHAAHTSGKCIDGRCNKAWGDIAYHYLVDRFGNIIEGRDLRFSPNSGSQGKGSAGTAGNYHYPGHFAVVFAGNFNVQSPTPEALLSAARVLSAAQLRFKLGSEAILPHRHHSPLGTQNAGWGTTCPGNNFSEEHHQTLVKLTTAISIQTILANSSCDPGVIDGIIGNDTRDAIRRLETVSGDLPSEPVQLLSSLLELNERCQ